ncbi:MRC1-like protein, partial [Mya arenaria]
MQPMFDGQPMLCGPGWYEYGSSCYLVDTTDPSTWQTASENCTAMGAHLAVITDAAENTFIVNLMTSLNMESEVFWLGGNDIAVEGTHVWETTEPFNFTYSFDIGSGNTAMDCICVVQFYGWYDRFCTEAWYHPISCEPGWYNYGSSCYMVETTATSTWQTARDNCAALGAHLAVITDAAENSFIVNLLTSLNIGFPVFWLGGNDIAVEGTYVWETAE